MKRITWVDSLKGFGIVCVTLGHLSCNYLLETHIYSFHMFLFFFLSGFLHSNHQQNFRQFVARKTKSLLVPFLFWNALSCWAGLFLGETLSNSVRLFFLLDGVICWNAPIWFLLELYMAEIAFYCIRQYIPYGEYCSIPLLLLLWVFMSGQNIFLKLNILPVCLLFYILGNLYRQHYGCLEKYARLQQSGVPICILLLIVNIVFGVFLNPRISFTGANFGNVFYCSLSALSGVLFYFTVFQKIPCLAENQLLSYLGRNSLVIMASQYWFFLLFDILSNRLLGISAWYYRDTLKALVVAAITITLICAITEALKRCSKRNLLIKKVCVWLGIRL